MSKKPAAGSIENPAIKLTGTSKITNLTPELLAQLLAMDWPSTNAGRMYLKRRGTTADKLGLIFGMAPEGRQGIALYQRDQPAAPATKKGKKAATPAVDPYESFAGQVDAMLVERREEAVPESVLRDFFHRGIEAQLAVDKIIADRTAALEQANAKADKAAETAALVARAVRAAAAAPKRGKATPAQAPEPAAATPAAGQVFLQLGDSMDRSAADLWAPKLAKQLRVAIHVCDALTGKVISTAQPGEPRQPRAPRAASSGERKNDTLAIVIPLMEREGGLSGEEVRAALNWKTPPGAWYFNHWAEKAGRGSDLIDMGKVDGVRRFRLNPRPAAA